MKAHLLTFALSVLTFILPSPTPAGEFVSVRYLDPTFGVTVTRNVSYGSVLNLSRNVVEDLSLDIYEPTGDSSEARAVVFWIHGGGFTDGDKEEMTLLCHYFAERGYVAISANYRLVSVWDRQNLGATYASSDIQAAVRWLRSEASTWRIDTERIALCGTSSGGYGVLGASYDQDLVFHNPNFQSQSSDVAACAEVSGRLYNLPSMQRGDPPLMIIHGMQDDRVPFYYALDLETQANAVGVRNEEYYLPLMGHTLLRAMPDEISDRILDFLYRNMIEE